MSTARYSTDHRIDEAVRLMIKRGWHVKSRKRHTKLVSPQGHIAIVPGSPSCHKSAINWIHDLRRMGVDVTDF